MIENKLMVKSRDRQALHSDAAGLIKSVSSVLDIGCGIRPQQYVIPDFLICVEPHLEYVEILKKNLQNSNAIIIPLDAKRALSALPDRSIDSVFLIDVIEHMPKEIGTAVIKECERVARQQVVVFTPLGFMPQDICGGDIDGWNLHGGEWQEHKSGWYPEDFPGWNIVVCEHLHFNDYKGEQITPPYGGFYAIRNKPRLANYFNDIYAKDVILNETSDLHSIHKTFPEFIDQVVYRDIEKSNLKCGIQSCQRMTELFIELGSKKETDEIFELVERDKSDAFLKEAQMHRERIKRFAAQFLEVNAREAELTARGAEITERETAQAAREAELTARGAEITERETAQAAREADLMARTPTFNNLLFVRVFRWMLGGK